MIADARRFSSAILLPALFLFSVHSLAQESPAPGQFITIRGTIDSSKVQEVKAAVRNALSDEAEILVFDIQSGQSDFGSCYDLADFIAEIGGTVRRTVAFVSQPITGNSVLVVLACDEIVLADGASIGDVDPQNQLKGRERAVFEDIAIDKGHGRWIAQGLTDNGVTLLEVETPNGRTVKTAQELQEFSKTARVLNKRVVKDKGQSWVVDAEIGQKLGVVRLIRDTRKEVAVAYGLSEQVAAEDASFKKAINPCILRIDGIVNQQLYLSIRRRLTDAERRKCEMLLVEIRSTSGDPVAAASIMDALSRFPGRTVAWVPEQATGPATLLLFGCDELVVGPDARIGDFSTKDESEEGYAQLADGAVQTAKGSKYPEALVRGLIDRQVAVYEVKSKENPGLRSYRTEAELENPDVADQWEKGRLVKEAGAVLTIHSGEQAKSLDLAVGIVDSQEKLLSNYGIEGSVPVLQPTWVDSLVDGLTSPGATVFLLVVAMTCLYIELQMPGFGIGGLISAVCFVLFFWSRFLSETANSLEVIMFLLGCIFLAIELFVVPGFGITGIAGILLMVGSLVLASQNFALPQSDAEMKVLLGNVSQLFGAVFLFLVMAGLLARFFPQVPILGRMILTPPGQLEEVDYDEPEEREIGPYHDLLGVVGIAASPLRPAGRMKIGDELFDVIAAGEFIEPGCPVEVVETYQNRIVVRPVDPNALSNRPRVLG